MRSPRSGRTGKTGSRTHRAKGKTAPTTAPMPKAGRPDRMADRITRSAPRQHPALLTGPAGAGARAATPASAASAEAGQRERTEPSVLALATPDWLAHTLTVSGPADRVAAFRMAAVGPGILPLQDRAGLEEDVMHALLAPLPALREISLVGARILAGQIGERIEAHASRAAGRFPRCPFDLNALTPVPPALSGLPLDDPRLADWLWRHWGTTWPLRQVAECTAAEPDHAALPAGHGFCGYRFWSADWTPWPALATIRAAWPDLRFVVSVHYGGA
jgi:hypothetical protein